MTPEELTGAIECAIKKHINTIEGHAADHEFIEMLKEREKRRIALVQKIKGNVIVWGVISFLAWVGTVGYELITKGGTNGH